MLLVAPLLLLVAVSPPEDPFQRWLAGADAAADGFAPPVAEPRGWEVTRVAPDRERWTRADSRTAFVLASARGRVTKVDAHQVVLTHTFYENYHRHEVVTRYEGLARPTVTLGAVVARGATVGVVMGVPATFAFALTSAARPREESPSTFIARVVRAPLPLDEDVLVLVHHDSYRMQVYEHGERTEDLRIGFGQAEGQKRIQGDLKSPKGAYFVTERYRGAFSGKWGAYYGGHWIKLNYPNAFDAAWGHEQGLLTKEQQATIATAWAARSLPPQNTRLGGGIGFHGWISEWADEDPHLSWGCVVLHLRDVARVFDRIPVGAMVVLF